MWMRALEDEEEGITKFTFAQRADGTDDAEIGPIRRE
jgi:hypothetical protein